MLLHRQIPVHVQPETLARRQHGRISTAPFAVAVFLADLDLRALYRRAQAHRGITDLPVGRPTNIGAGRHLCGDRLPAGAYTRGEWTPSADACLL